MEYFASRKSIQLSRFHSKNCYATLQCYFLFLFFLYSSHFNLVWMYLVFFFTGQVGQLTEANKALSGELKLFLEVELGLVMICWTYASFLCCMIIILVSAVVLSCESLPNSVYSFRICGLSLLLRSSRMTFFFSSNSTTQKRKNFGTSSVWTDDIFILSSVVLLYPPLKKNVSSCGSWHCYIHVVLWGGSSWRPSANLQKSWQN